MARDTNAPKTVVGIPTYKRPRELEALLESLAAGIEGVSNVRIDVLDNEPSDQTRAIVESAQRDLPNLRYISSPEPGIAAVRNRALELARDADFLCFVDDDETVPAGWLAGLLSAADRYQADVVVGPVLSETSGVATWVAGAAYAHDQPRLPDGATLPWCATNNTLISLRARNAVPEGFDERFSATGGSDNHYFFRASTRGSRIVWVNTPPVFEEVAVERISPRWLIRRAYRSGTIRSRIEIDVLGAGRFTPWKAWFLTRVSKGVAGIALGAIELGVFLVLRDKQRALHAAMRVSGGLGTLGGFMSLYGPDYVRSDVADATPPAPPLPT